MISRFFEWRRKRKLDRIAGREEHRRAVILRQIAERRKGHREFRPLYGDLRRSTHAALAAECGIEWR